MVGFKIALSVVCLFVFGSVYGDKLREEFTWTSISYIWPNNSSKCGGEPSVTGGDDFDSGLVFPEESHRPYRPKWRPSKGYGKYGVFSRAGGPLQEETYVRENNIPMGANRYKRRIFTTVPRRRPGIPATLNYISLDCPNRHNVPYIPYPSLKQNSLTTARPTDETDVNHPFVSVYRTSVDACGRLWFVDTGILEYPTGRQIVHNGAIIVIDLSTDTVIRRYPLPETVANERSTLASVTVDVTSSTCDDAYAYVPDLVNYQLIVYSFRQDDSWVVNHNYFFLHPLGGEFQIGGYQFQWNDGIFSVALSKVNPDGYRTAYFHAMASTQEFSVSTRILRDRDLAERSYHEGDFRLVGDRGMRGQSSTHTIHQPSGIMFLALVNQNGIGCWNTNKEFPRNNHLIHQDARKMIYPSDMNIEGNVITMYSNSMPVFIYGTLDFNQINFRIWTSTVENAIRGTGCGRR